MRLSTSPRTAWVCRIAHRFVLGNGDLGQRPRRRSRAGRYAGQHDGGRFGHTRHRRGHYVQDPAIAATVCELAVGTVRGPQVSISSAIASVSQPSSRCTGLPPGARSSSVPISACRLRTRTSATPSVRHARHHRVVDQHEQAPPPSTRVETSSRVRSDRYTRPLPSLDAQPRDAQPDPQPSTQAGEVQAEMMQAEVTDLAAPKGPTTPPGPTPVTAPSLARSPLVGGVCR
jgi:hypothetical protein